MVRTTQQTSTPKPVRGSRSGRPVMAALDILGRRWTLGIIWAMRDGPIGFRALQDALGGASPDTISRRLKDMADFGLVVRDANQQWMLTKRGQDLLPILIDLNQWAAAGASR